MSPNVLTKAPLLKACSWFCLCSVELISVYSSSPLPLLSMYVDTFLLSPLSPPGGSGLSCLYFCKYCLSHGPPNKTSAKSCLMQRAVTGNVQEGAEKMIFSQNHFSIFSGDLPEMLVQSREDARTPESGVELLGSSPWP